MSECMEVDLEERLYPVVRDAECQLVRVCWLVQGKTLEPEWITDRGYRDIRPGSRWHPTAEELADWKIGMILGQAG